MCVYFKITNNILILILLTTVNVAELRTFVYANSGTLFSDGHPGNYSNDQHYATLVTLDQAGPQTVSMNITVNLESGYDYLEVNGDGTLYSGNGSASKTITVTGSTWTVTFYSDSSVTRSAGFILTYTV